MLDRQNIRFEEEKSSKEAVNAYLSTVDEYEPFL